MTVRIIIGDVREKLRELPDDSVHCVVSSPPYWGLRDYGTAAWEGGDPTCDHAVVDAERTAWANSVKGPAGASGKNGSKYANMTKEVGGRCEKCGATRVDKQIGLEPTPYAFVDTMVAVFREVRRVLRADGTLWLNLGDSYSSHDPGGRRDGEFLNPGGRQSAEAKGARNRAGTHVDDLPRKNLIGIPWRVAFALQQPYYSGRIKRMEDRIWLAAMIDGEGCMFIHKRKAGTGNHSAYTKKDGSVSRYDRTQDNYGAGLEIANTHESIVRRCLEITGLGSICRQEKERKQPLFRWNLRSNECREVVREIYPHLVGKQHQARLLFGCPSSGKDAEAAHASLMALHNGRPATIDFPAPPTMFEPGWYLRQDLIWSKLNPMPESIKDRCTKSHEYLFLLSKSARYHYDAEAIAEALLSEPHAPGNKALAGGKSDAGHMDGRVWGLNGTRNRRSVWTVATQPFKEAHFATFPPDLIEPCIKAGCPKGGCVLDPFGGAGTTGLVADRLQRDAILIELNPEYAGIAERRIHGDAPMFAMVSA